LLFTQVPTKSSRVCVHLKEVFKKENYNCIVLEDNLVNKAKTKERKAFYMGVFEHSVVKKKRPILIDMKDYQKAYQKEYRKNTQYPPLNYILRNFM
jgi:hypothetical protein